MARASPRPNWKSWWKISVAAGYLLLEESPRNSSWVGGRKKGGDFQATTAGRGVGVGSTVVRVDTYGGNIQQEVTGQADGGGEDA